MIKNRLNVDRSFCGILGVTDGIRRFYGFVLGRKRLAKLGVEGAKRAVNDLAGAVGIKSLNSAFCLFSL